MFANPGAILAGQVPLIPVDVFGSRLVTKGMFLFSAFINYDIDKLFGAKGIAYSSYPISELFSTASKFSLGLSYGFAGATVFFSVLRLCMQDYKNSPWKLY